MLPRRHRLAPSARYATISDGVTVLGGVLVEYIDQVLGIMMDWYVGGEASDG